MKIIKIIFKELLPLIIALLSLYLSNKIPIEISFIPQDKSYEVSLTLYSIIIAVICRAVPFFIDCFENRKSFVKIEFAEGKPKFEGSKIINCDFESDVAIVYIKIDLEGKPRKFINKQLKIVLPLQVEAQKIQKYSDVCELTGGKKSILIDLEKLFNTEKKEKINDSKIVGFTIIKNEEEVNSRAEVVIVNNEKQKVVLVKNGLLFRK